MLSNVNGCCKIVGEFERCVCQCPQLSFPLHYPRNRDGLGVPDDHALDQNSSPDLDGLVCGQSSGFETEMRGMLVEKTSPGLRTLVRLLQKSEGFVFFSYVGDAGNTSLVDAGTPLGATAVVTPGSAGYLLWKWLHPGVPVMWYGHIRDLLPTAGGCKGGRMPNVTRLHWAQQK